MILFISIAVYVLSVLGIWKLFQIVYSEGGRWSNIKPNGTDIFMTLCPVLNTIGYFSLLLSGIKQNKNKPDYSKFFKIK